MPGAHVQVQGRGLIAQYPLQRRVSPQIGKLHGRLYIGTVMVPLWLEKAVPTTLTLKNIPDGGRVLSLQWAA